jgi:hypothetical protein
MHEECHAGKRSFWPTYANLLGGWLWSAKHVVEYYTHVGVSPNSHIAPNKVQ